MPSLLKSPIVLHINKVSPPGSTEKDLTPISLTFEIAKVMECFTRSRLLPQWDSKIDHRQYSRKGHSKTDALFCIYASLKRVVHQGTKLGVILFPVMTKKLLSDWWPRIKSVDDTSALKIIPKNSTH